MVYGTYNEVVTGANLNQQTSLRGLTLYVYIYIYGNSYHLDDDIMKYREISGFNHTKQTLGRWDVGIDGWMMEHWNQS